MPRSVWCFSPRLSPWTSSWMALGWSPRGSYSETILKGRSIFGRECISLSVMARWLLILVAACSSGLPSAQPDLAAARDLLTSSMGCMKDADCRLYSSTCEGCDCLGLAINDPDPVCNGMMVSCFVDPCDGKVARCSGGACIVQ